MPAGEAAGAINSTALILSLLKDRPDESLAAIRIQVSLPACLAAWLHACLCCAARMRTLCSTHA
jgi:hypothetical protein